MNFFRLQPNEVTFRVVTKMRLECDHVSVKSLALLHQKRYLALRDIRIHVRVLHTYQGRNPQTTNGCTVIAPLTCVRYFTSSKRDVVKSSPSDEYAWRCGIPDNLSSITSSTSTPP